MSSKMLHTCLRVENLEKSIAFYQDAFGFEENVGKIFQTTSLRLSIWPCLEMTMSWN
ncbi:Lactoylglutathione lyase [Streptococcus sp. ZB199]|nr:Lactoylglutathione lyase [Streptococcus sp. ZB199]